MKRLTSLPLIFSLLFPSSVLALPPCTVFSHQAQQGQSKSLVIVEVAPGRGTNINFIPTGETIKKAWLDDLSRILLSFDKNLCIAGSLDQNCNNEGEGATVGHLRLNGFIDFKMPRSPTGETLFSAITEGDEGRKLYQIKVIPVSIEPKCTSLTIVPDSEQPTLSPIIPSRQPPVVRPSVLDQLPTTTSSIQRQTALAQKPSSITTTTEQPLAVPTPPPSFARAATRVSSNPTPQNNWTPEPPKQPVPTSTPKRSPTSTKLATSSPQEMVAAPNPPSSSRKVSQQSRVAIRSPLTTKPQQRTAKPRVQRVTASRTTRERTTVVINSSVVRANKDPQQSTDDANAIAFGLRTANENGQIKTRSTMWRKAQSAIRLLRRGKTRVEAAQIANIPENTLEQLIKWGQQRP